MAVNRDGTRTGHPLPCGRDVEQVWGDLEAGRTSEHAASCPHCATARSSLEQLAEATRLLVADPVEPPSGLLDRIMAAVRADLVHGDAIPLPTPGGRGAAADTGGVDISRHALAAVLRFVVDGVTGLRAHHCRVELDPHAPHAVRVAMSVSLGYGFGRVAAVTEARRRVRAALSERIGVALQTLDVEVVDVWVDEDGPRGEGAQ